MIPSAPQSYRRRPAVGPRRRPQAVVAHERRPGYDVPAVTTVAPGRAPVGATVAAPLGSPDDPGWTDDAGRADAGRGDVDLLDAVSRRVCDPARIAALDDDALREHVRLAQRLEGRAAVLTARATHELSRRGALGRDGAPSTAEWVRATTGRSGRDAARVARLAGSLADLPDTAAALEDGRVGIESADTIVRAARDTTLGAPDQVERTLLPVATATSPERLRAEVRRREQQVEPDALLRDERRQHARRRLALVHRDDGMWDVHGRLAGEVGNRVRTLLDVFDRPDAPDAPDAPPGRRRRHEQRLADALDAAATAALDVADLPAHGGVGRPHVSVVVDLATFDADLSDPDGADRPVAPDAPVWRGLAGARTAWGATLSPQAARRICCDAAIARVVTLGGSQVLDVGRATRRWSPAQRRAVDTRDGGCRGPACSRPVGWTQIHHVRWWRHGGATDVANGLALCHACHRLVHDLGWHVVLDPVTAAATWTTPDRRRTVVTHPRRPS